MNEWLNTHYLQLIAITIGFIVRWGAGQFLANANKTSKGAKKEKPASTGKWNKERIIKFVSLFFYFVAGLLFAYGAFPIAQWLVSWGSGFGSWVSVFFGVLLVAAGWHALHGIVGLIYDMSDGTPDKEAFSAAFMVPTTLPLGGAALFGLFSNPRGAATGVAVVAVSIVTIVYAHKILDKVNQAKGHYKIWMYFATFICALVGFIHIPALIYINDMAGSYLPEWAAWSARLIVVAIGVVLVMVGSADWIRDWIPETWTQRAAMYSIPVFTVLGVAWSQLTANAETSLTTIFSAFG